MKVFISWSGNLSKNLAEILRQWLPAVIQAVKPYYTPDDITKGTRWGKEIAKELEESQVGLICVTRENIEKPWIMFEAGALSKNLDESRVCPILFDLSPSDIKGPLVQFQLAQFEKSDMKRVVKMINAALGNTALDVLVLDSVFEMWWPKLKESVDNELKPDRHTDKIVLRSERDLLEEVLELVRYQTKATGMLNDIPGWARAGKESLYDLSRGDDVQVFAGSVHLQGDLADPNALQWSEVENPPESDSIEGHWSSRWNGGVAGDIWVVGTAVIKSVDPHVYILHCDEMAACLIATRRETPNRLVGRYINLLHPSDSTSWVGLIVNNERIDGKWASGRWDLRRNLSDK